VLICVPTPLSRNRDPDLSYVEATTRSIASNLRPGQLIERPFPLRPRLEPFCGSLYATASVTMDSTNRRIVRASRLAAIPCCTLS
jgi:UDP-glucose/GDP-mannose dehydrogenase family, NAD binding domain